MTAVTATLPGQSGLLVRPTWRLVLMLALPALLQNWLIMTVNLSDRLLAGRFQVADEETVSATLAAQTTAQYLAWLMSSVPVLVNVGATTLVAHAIGGGRRREAQLVLHQALLLAGVIGVVGAVMGLVCLEAGLWLLQVDGAVAIHAARYLQPLLLVLPLHMVGIAGIACLVGAGDTRTGLLALGGVAVLNLPMAWLFCRGAGPIPGLGFPGIAIGTALSQALGATAVLLVLARGRAGLRLHLRRLRPRLDLLRRLLRISVPAGIDSLSMQIGYLWFAGLVNGLGETSAAAHGIALAWEGLGYHSGAGFGAAAIAVVGLYRGAGHPERATRGGFVAFALGATVMSVMGAVFFTLAEEMFVLLCPNDGQAAIREVGVPVLRLVAFGMPALASCMILAQALRGAGDTRFPMLFTWVGFFGVRIPLTFLLTRERVDLGVVSVPGAGLGLYGAWLAMFADMHLRGLLLLWRFASGRWRTIRV